MKNLRRAVVASALRFSTHSFAQMALRSLGIESGRASSHADMHRSRQINDVRYRGMRECHRNSRGVDPDAGRW